MLGQLPLYATGGQGFSPASLALTGFFRNYTNPNWPGTASNGTSGSGSNDLTDPGAEPAQGTPLNGWGTADFNGSDDYLVHEGTLDTYISALAFSGWILLNPDSTEKRIWYDDNGTVDLFIGGLGGAILSINGVSASVSRALSTGVYSLVTFRYNGTNLQVGVNEIPGSAGGGSTTAYSSNLTPLSGNLYLGMGNSIFYDGHVAEYAVTDIALTDQNFTDVKAYINARYALSL